MPEIVLDFNDSTKHEKDFMAEWIYDRLSENDIDASSFAYNIHVEYEEDTDA